jgi:hypothetical protein
MSSEAAMNPTGGAESRRVMERCPLALVSVQCNSLVLLEHF